MKQYNNRNELYTTWYKHILFAVCSTAEHNSDNVHFLELIVKKREIKKKTAKWGKGRKKRKERIKDEN